jgi:hypothetical protein
MHALIGREACFYECLETPEISRLQLRFQNVKKTILTRGVIGGKM